MLGHSYCVLISGWLCRFVKFSGPRQKVPGSWVQLVSQAGRSRALGGWVAAPGCWCIAISGVLHRHPRVLPVGVSAL